MRTKAPLPLWPLALLVLTTSAGTAGATEIPLGSFLAPEVWQQSSPYPAEGDGTSVFESIVITRFISTDRPAALGLTLSSPNDIDLSVSALDGFGLVIGNPEVDDANELTVRLDYPRVLSFATIRPDEVLAALRFPTSVVHAPGAPEEATHLLIRAPETAPILTDLDGGVLFPGLTLGPTQIAGTDLILEAAEVLVDLHPTESVDGMAPEFQGVRLQGVSITPPSLGDEPLAGVTVEDLTIGPEGVQGRICASSGRIDLPAGTVAITSACFDLDSSADEPFVLVSVEGELTLPATLFGCDDGGLTIPISGTGGTFSGAVEVADLPAGCAEMDFGGDLSLTLGGPSSPSVSCDGSTSTVTMASRISVSVDADSGEITLSGTSAGTPASLGRVGMPPSILSPATAQEALYLPSSLALGPDGLCVGCEGQGLDLPRMRVADTDVTVCASNVVLDLDSSRLAWTAAGAPRGTTAGPDWRGIYAAAIQVTLPGELNPASDAPLGITGQRFALGSGELWTTLVLSEAVPLSIPGLPGVQALIGDSAAPDPSLVVGFANDAFSLYGLSGIVGAIRLPHPALSRLSDPAQPWHVDVVADAQTPLTANRSGDWILQLTSALPAAIGETGASIGAVDLVIDNSSSATPSEICSARNEGAGCAFEGVFLQSLELDLPESVGGLLGVEARDFFVSAEGVSGQVDATFAPPGLDLDLGGMGAAITSFCVDFSVTSGSQSLSPCGISGTLTLPPDLLACQGGEPLSAGFEWTEDAGYVATLDLQDGSVPERCRDLDFGIAGARLALGGPASPAWTCGPGTSGTAATPAARLRIEVEKDPFELTLRGLAADGSTPAPVGLLRMSDALRPTTDAKAMVLPSTLVIGDEGTCIGCGAGSGVALPPSDLGGSGIVVCADDVAVDSHTGLNAWAASGAPEGLSTAPPAWRGLYLGSATLELPFDVDDAGNKLTIGADNLAIGKDGLSGELSAMADTILYAGFPVTDVDVALTLRNSKPTAATVSGTLNVDFIDQPLPITFSLDGKGGWLAAVGSGDGEPIVVEKGSGDVKLRLLLSRLAFGNEGDAFFVEMDAGVSVESGLFDTGQLDVQGLKITSEGEVDVDGGYYTFSEPRTMTLGGFSYEVSGVGFGTRDDGRRYASLGGVFQLQDLPVEASVHDIGVSWEAGGGSPRVEVGAIDVSMEVPNVLELHGGLRFCEAGMPGCEAPDAVGAKWFEGDAEVQLTAPPMTLGGKLMVGKSPADGGWSFWFVQVDAQLPTGIPIPATGVSIYGFKGGLGKNVALNITDTFPRGIDRERPVVPKRGKFVLLAGATLGSAHDNGFLINTDATLRLEIPGPVIAFSGEAWILTQRADRGEPLITADIIYDRPGKMFLFSMAARYRINRDSGGILDVSGGMEVLLSPEAWHVYIGTRENPMRAEVLSILEAESYTMFGNDVPTEDGPKKAFITGMHWKLESSGKLGPAGYSVGLYAGGEVAFQMHPKQLQVAFEAGGHVRVWLGPIKAGLALDTSITGQVAKPFKLDAEARVRVDTPWPFPDIKGTIHLGWEKDYGEHTYPRALKEVVFESQATGETVVAYDTQPSEPLPAGTVVDVPFDSVVKATFNRRVDCTRHDSDPCDDNGMADQYFTDEVGDDVIRQVLHDVELTADIDGSSIPIAGGWGGALGAPEPGPSAERRYEAYTFQPAGFAWGTCPGTLAPSGECRVTTTVPPVCRVARQFDACYQRGASTAVSRPTGSFYDPITQRTWWDKGGKLEQWGECSAPGTVGEGTCGPVPQAPMIPPPLSHVPQPPPLPPGFWGDRSQQPEAPNARACCLPSGACGYSTGSACVDSGGHQMPPGADCEPGGCGAWLPGACCAADGCEIRTPADCALQGGNAYPGYQCSAQICGETPEPCCCSEPMSPIICEGGGEAEIVDGLLVDESYLLWRTHDDQPPTLAGYCFPVAGVTPTGCPSDDPNLCEALESEQAVECVDLFFRFVVPAPELAETTLDCDPDIDVVEGMPFCAGDTYTLDLPTSTLVNGSAVTGNDAEGTSITFRVEAPPDDLSPYVAWTHPAQDQRPVYTDDDVVVAFHSARLCEAYSCCQGMEILDMQLLAAGSAGDAPQQVAGRVLRKGCSPELDDDIPSLGTAGDFLVFDPDQPLAPNALYEVRVTGEGGQLYTAHFVTSEHLHFGAALSGAQASLEGSSIVIVTDEALDWEHVSLTVGGQDVQDRRVSDAGSSVHVFALGAGDPSPSPGETITLTYRSQPHGCSANDCEGRVARRGGQAIHEPVDLILNAGGDL